MAPDEEATSVGWGCKINKFCTFYTVNSLRAAPAAGRLPGPSVVGAYRRGAWGPLGPPGGPRLAADAPCGRAGGSARMLVAGASPQLTRARAGGRWKNEEGKTCRGAICNADEGRKIMQIRLQPA